MKIQVHVNQGYSTKLLMGQYCQRKRYLIRQQRQWANWHPILFTLQWCPWKYFQELSFLQKFDALFGFNCCNTFCSQFLIRHSCCACFPVLNLSYKNLLSPFCYTCNPSQFKICKYLGSCLVCPYLKSYYMCWKGWLLIEYSWTNWKNEGQESNALELRIIEENDRKWLENYR